jgi:hypothetical protein
MVSRSRPRFAVTKLKGNSFESPRDDGNLRVNKRKFSSWLDNVCDQSLSYQFPSSPVRAGVPTRQRIPAADHAVWIRASVSSLRMAKMNESTPYESIDAGSDSVLLGHDDCRMGIGSGRRSQIMDNGQTLPSSIGRNLGLGANVAVWRLEK